MELHVLMDSLGSAAFFSGTKGSFNFNITTWRGEAIPEAAAERMKAARARGSIQKVGNNFERTELF